MLKKWIKKFKLTFNRLKPHLIVTLGQWAIKLILITCRWEVKGLKNFKKIALNEKCALVLWHNRLALIAPILYKYAPEFIYAAFVSKSRDGEMISAVVHSYKAGRTIRVSHDARHQALKEMVEHLNTKKEILIITPDGPRGPKYQVKPGIAVAAKETGCYIVPISWKAKSYWELNSWDKLRLPKPFSKISVNFGPPVLYSKEMGVAEIQQKIQEQLQED